MTSFRNANFDKILSLPSAAPQTPSLLLFCFREVSNSVTNAKGSETLSTPCRAQRVPPIFLSGQKGQHPCATAWSGQADLLEANAFYKVFFSQVFSHGPQRPCFLSCSLSENGQSLSVGFGVWSWSTLLPSGHTPWSWVKKTRKTARICFCGFLKQTLTCYTTVTQVTSLLYLKCHPWERLKAVPPLNVGPESAQKAGGGWFSETWINTETSPLLSTFLPGRIAHAASTVASQSCTEG